MEQIWTWDGAKLAATESQWEDDWENSTEAVEVGSDCLMIALDAILAEGKSWWEF